MLKIKSSFIFSIAVVLCCFCLLSTGLMQPIQIAQAREMKQDSSIALDNFLSTLSDISIDTTGDSENQYIITVGDTSITFEEIEKGFRVSAVIDNELTTYEVTADVEPKSDIAARSASSNSNPVQLSLNGTKFDMPLDVFAALDNNDEPPETRVISPYTTYMWDGIFFEEGFDGSVNPPIDIGYPHPIKGAPNYVSQFEDWYGIGNTLVHYQFEHALSQALVTGSIAVAFGAIGAGIGAFGGGVGAVVGALIGGALGVVYSYLTHTLYLDEDDCLWLWFDKWMPGDVSNFAAYLALYDIGVIETYHIEWVVNQLDYSNYLRLGTKTYFNGLGITDPAPPPPIYYALSATSSHTGNGDVIDKDNILYAPNGIYAYLKSGDYGYKAEITATFSNTPISGTLCLQCYTPSATGANLRVFVVNQYGVWTELQQHNLYPPNQVTVYNYGYVYNIVGVSVVAYHQFYINGVYYPSYIYADAVWVQ